MTRILIARSARPAVLAAVALLLALAVAGGARAQRPGWFSTPTITGSAAVGATLSASDGGLYCEPGCTPAGPNPEYAGTFFEWVACAGPSGGGADRPAGGMPDDPRPAPGCVSRGTPSKSALTYTVRAEDAGRWIQLHVVATAYDCGEVNRSTGEQECRYSSGHGYSATIGPIPGSPVSPPPPAAASEPPNLTAYPTTSGAAKEGETLRVDNGSWRGSPTRFEYQWKRCAPEFEPCSPIAGATSSSYVLGVDDVGKRVQVLVTASNAKGANSAASFPTDVVASTAVAPANTAVPTITGLPEDRQTLTAAPGTWTGTEPMTFAYQWLRCSSALAGCTPIEGATAERYTVTREDLAARLLVTVTATNRAGVATGTSGRTEYVVAAKPRPGSDRLAIEDVTSPNKLVVADVLPARRMLRARGSVALSVRVTDRRGFLIEGARVAVAGPRGAIVAGGPVATDARGIASLRVRAGAKLPKRQVVLTLTVTKPGAPELTASKRIEVACAARSTPAK